MKDSLFKIVMTLLWLGLALERIWFYNNQFLNAPDEEHIIQQQTFPRDHTLSALNLHKADLSTVARNQWCPFAKCPVTSICHPCQRRYLIVLAVGRSASTTLQNMLFDLPGIRMSGENNGVLPNFRRATQTTTQRNEWRLYGVENRRNAWGHYQVPPSSLACVTQQMVETINPPANLHEEDDSETIVGFKTIRFPEHASDFISYTQELNKRTRRQRRALPKESSTTDSTESVREAVQQAAAWLKETFPCARMVVNIRSNVSLQSQSSQKAFRGPLNRNMRLQEEELRQRNEQLTLLAEFLGPRRAYFLDSTQWAHNVSLINDMISWLGFADACHYDQLFEYNTKNSYGTGNVTSRTNPPGCHKLPF